MTNSITLKLFNFFRSMKFGIFLLTSSILLSMLGTFIPQSRDGDFYNSMFNPLVARLILFLGLNDIYNSIPFAALFGSLSINLVMCSLTRFGNIIAGLKASPRIENMTLITSFSSEAFNPIETSVEEIFMKYGFRRFRHFKDEPSLYLSIKNKSGYFGSWLLHLGILLVIVCYTYGNVTYFSESVFGISGSVQAIQGTEYKARIQDFNIEYRQDGSVQQYISKVELLDADENPLKSSLVSVNNPMRFKGYTFYQTSYGWAANCKIMKNGQRLMEDTIYERTSLNMPNENIGIYLNRFYPDFAASSEGMISLSEQPENPAFLYSLIYMDEIVKMDVITMGEVIKWNDYDFILEKPQRYTYLNVNRMKGQQGAVLGSILVIMGLILTFFFKPVKMALRLELGKTYVYGDNLLKKIILMNKGEE